MPETTFLKLSDVALQSNRRITLHPQVFAHLGEFRVPGKTSSVPEAEAPFPICPQAEPTDTVIYRDGKDPSKTFFLQRYQLRSNSQGRYEISIERGSDSLWSMKFGLAPYPASEVAEEARASQPLPHRPVWSLRYVVAGTTIEKEFQAFAVTPDPNGMVIEFRLTLEGRDEVLRAFRSDTAQARLVATRQVDVCIPAPSEPVGDSHPPNPPFNILVSERKKVALDAATGQPVFVRTDKWRVQP